MGRTAGTKERSRPSAMTDKQRMFADRYLVHLNATRAAQEAGYKGDVKSLQCQGSQILSTPNVKLYVASRMEKMRKAHELDAEEILKQLAYCATRSGADFIDADGLIISDIRLLPERAQQAIDSIEQTTDTYYDADGTEHTKVRTKLWLANKLHAIELAMKHKNLFAPEQQNIKVTLDFDALTAKPDPKKIIDVVAQRIEQAHSLQESPKTTEPVKPLHYTVDELAEPEEHTNGQL